MDKVRAAFSKYYETERNRSEACLGDIINILSRGDMDDAEQVANIVNRLIKHYSR